MVWLHGLGDNAPRPSASGSSASIAPGVQQVTGSVAARSWPPSNVIVSVDVGDVRSLNLGVRDNPWPAGSDGHPRDAAHALVTGLNELGSKPQLRCRRHLAKLPSITLSIQTPDQ